MHGPFLFYNYDFSDAETVYLQKRIGILPRCPKFISRTAKATVAEVRCDLVVRDNLTKDTFREENLLTIPRKYLEDPHFTILKTESHIKLDGIMRSVSQHHPGLKLSRANLAIDGVPESKGAKKNLKVQSVGIERPFCKSF